MRSHLVRGTTFEQLGKLDVALTLSFPVIYLKHKLFNSGVKSSHILSFINLNYPKFLVIIHHFTSKENIIYHKILLDQNLELSTIPSKHFKQSTATLPGCRLYWTWSSLNHRLQKSLARRERNKRLISTVCRST